MGKRSGFMYILKFEELKFMYMIFKLHVYSCFSNYLVGLRSSIIESNLLGSSSKLSEVSLGF